MNLKQQIAQNEERLRQYRDFVDAIDLLEQSKDDKKAIAFLLELQKLEFAGRIERGERQQELLKKQRMAEFEVESAEANLRIDKMVEELGKWIGKEPLGVTCKIEPLVGAYRREMDGISQERRNELYLEMRGHWEFLTKTYKNK